MSERTFVIAGASLAGAKAAEQLRERGFDGRVVLVGAEQQRPYERPPLSKDYLRGESELDGAYVHAASFYEDNGIELRTGTAIESIDATASEATLAGGERLRYDRLLLATGAEPRRLEVPGADLDGVHYLRTADDSEALRRRLARGGHAVVIGAGWIGAEVAASARQRGCGVTMIARGSVPLERVLGRELGAVYRDIHADHGVEMRLGADVERLEGAGSVERVRTSEGATIDCDLVVVGVGVRPRTALAESGGLEVDNGILVSERLQTSVPNIYAAGDVANAYHPFYGTRIRVEHWANAIGQGEAVAGAMLAGEGAYDRIPYFFSDQYDVGMEYCGHVTAWDEVVLRGDPAGREFIAFWLQGGRVAAGMNVNVWDVNEQIQELIRSREPVARDRLRDPDLPLGDVPGSATR